MTKAKTRTKTHGTSPSTPTSKKPGFPDCPTPFSDHVYKTSHGVDVPLRLWPATAGTGPRPWLIWFHGGGFAFGKHYHPNPWVLPAFRSHGYHVVSVAYRLIPHVALWEVVEDSTDAFAWCRKHLPAAVSALGGQVDIDRYVAGGDSMGGLLVTLGGHNFCPRPRAIACMYAFTHPEDPYFHPPEGHMFEKILRVGEPGADVVPPPVAQAVENLAGGAGKVLAPIHPALVEFLTEVDALRKWRLENPHIDHAVPGMQKGSPSLPLDNPVQGMASIPYCGTYTAMEVFAYLSSRDQAAAAIAGPFRHELPPAVSTPELRKYWGMPDTWTPERAGIYGDGMMFLYAARWMIRVAGRRELYGSDGEWFDMLHKYSAVKLVVDRSKVLGEGEALEYPPAFFIHGTGDTTVPAYHSQKMAAALRAARVPVQERYAPGKAHAFDISIYGPESGMWGEYIAPCLEFVDAHVWADRPEGAVVGPFGSGSGSAGAGAGGRSVSAAAAAAAAASSSCVGGVIDVKSKL